MMIQVKRQCFLIVVLLFISSTIIAQQFEISERGIYIHSQKIFLGQSSDSLRILIGEPTRILKNALFFDSLGFIAVVDTVNRRVEEMHLVLKNESDQEPIRNCGVVKFYGLFINQSTPALMLSQAQLNLVHVGFGDYTAPYSNSVLVVRTQQNKTLRSISILKKWEEPGIEVYKLKGKRVFHIQVGDVVRLNHFSKRRPQSFKLAEVRDHQLTFFPLSDKLNAIVTSDETLDYFEITTFGTAVRGVIINTAIIGLYGLNYVILPFTSVILAVVTLGNFPVYKPVNIYLPFTDFHKHVKIFNKSGKRIWGVRVVNSHSLY